MEKKKIIFATANPGKLCEAAEILGPDFELVSAAEAGVPEDIPETGTTLRANALIKAEYLWRRTGLDCFADDTGLEVEILGGGPGVHTARYAGEGKDFNANIDKLLREMDRLSAEASSARALGLATPHATRRARFRTAVTLIVGGEKHFFDGVMEGTIARERRGAGGFGYDPVFQPEGCGGQTAAQISEVEKNAISHRGKALRAMAQWLRGE